MKENKLIFRVFIWGVILITSNCGNKNQNNKLSNKQIQLPTEELSKSEESYLSTDYVGNYHGIQGSYNLKNQYGEDMIINGNKVSVPSSDYKFLIKENNIVSLQQTNIEDNSRTYYDGKYSIIIDDANKIKLKCSLSDGNTSNPEYVLEINKIDKAGTCSGSSEPVFSIEKIK
jgi:hypothetical protein